MRIPPRTILMPFALSDPSFAAWSFARSLADRFKASLTAVHVHGWVVPAGTMPPPPLGPRARRDVKDRLAHVMGAEVALRFTEDGVVPELLAAAEEIGADLILMATEGRTGLRRLARESITEELVRRSPLPVLTVHGDATLPTTILAPVNEQPYALAGLDAAERWARALDAPLTVLNVQAKGEPPAAEARALLRERVGRAPERSRLKLDDGDPVGRILEEGCEHGMIVMVAHRKGRLHDAVLGTTAEQVLRRSPVPVLTIPGPERPRPPISRRRSAGRRRLTAARRRGPRARAGR